MQEGTSALGYTAVAKPRVPRSAAAVRPWNTEALPRLPLLPEIDAIPQAPAKKKTLPRARAIPRPHMKISFRAIMLFFIAIALLSFLVYSHMQLSQIQRTNQELHVRLTTLRRQEAQLKNQFESSVRLSEIEQYATAELGMVKPGPDQIVYIDLGGEDHAVIIEQKTWWQSIRDTLSSALVTARDNF